MKKLLGLIGGQLSYMVEFLYQIAYDGFAVTALLFLYTFVPVKDAIIYTAFIILHFASIGYWGNKMNSFDFGEEKKVTVGFVITNIILMFITAILTDRIITILLVLFLVFIGALYILFTERLICTTECSKRPILELIFEKCPHFFYGVLLLLPIIAIIIPMIFLPWNIFIKIAVVVVYIISMPFIAYLSDDGLDIGTIFGLY